MVICSSEDEVVLEKSFGGNLVCVDGGRRICRQEKKRSKPGPGVSGVVEMKIGQCERGSSS